MNPHHLYPPFQHLTRPPSPPLESTGKAELTAHPWKCHLGLIKVQYIGFHIIQGCWSYKRKGEKSFTKYQVHAFLKLVKYYWCFSPTVFHNSDFIMSGKPERIYWTRMTEQTYQALKTTLTIFPVPGVHFHEEEQPIFLCKWKKTDPYKVDQEALAFKWVIKELCYFFAR